MMEGGALIVEGNLKSKEEIMKIKELLKYAEEGITVYFVFEDVIEMEYYFDKNSSLSEADMEVLNMEPSKIWGWDDGTICVEVKING